MRTIQLFGGILVLLLSNLGYGQDKPIKLSNKPIDTLSNQLIQKFTYKTFSQIYFPNVTNGFGNYGSLNLTETNVKFAGNLVTKSGDVFGLTVNGGVTDGISSIFTNNKWNSQFGFDLSYNLMQGLYNKKKSKYVFYKNFEYYLDDEEEYLKKLKEIEFQEKREILMNDTTLKRREIQGMMNKIQIEILKTEKDIDELAKKIKTTISPEAIVQLEDSLNVKNHLELAKLEKSKALKLMQLDSLTSELNYIKKYPFAEIHKTDVKHYNKEKNLSNSFPMLGYNVRWFTINIGFSTNQFKHIDVTIPYDNQISKKGYGSTTIGLQYSGISKSTRIIKNYFYNISVSGKLGDNFSDLSDISINEKKQLDSITDRRYTDDKYTAYEGEYKTDQLSALFKGDFYQFFVDDQKMALHVYANYQVMQSLHPVTSFGTGLYFSFINTEKDKNPINLEIFYSFNNIFATNNPEVKKQYQRNQAGIRFIFPFNFNK